MTDDARIAEAVSDFRIAIPKARIYVYDNNFTDQSAERAQEAGGSAFVLRDDWRGAIFRTRALALLVAVAACFWLAVRA